MKKALGKGLSQLLGDQLNSASQLVPIQNLVPNQRQPRRHFDEDALEELADSIRVHGVLSPILVRPIAENKYEIIAGERRWRASQIAGLAEVPISVRTAAGQESLEIAIVENVQRADISAFESALAYYQLIEEFGLTQEQVALRVGKTRTSVSNTLRLLKLPTEVLEALQVGRITEGHARAMLSAGSLDRQLELLALTEREQLSVRQVEQRASDGATTQKKPQKKVAADPRPLGKDIHTKQLESMVSERLGSVARIERSASGGKIEIDFYDEDDLARILEQLGVEY